MKKVIIDNHANIISPKDLYKEFAKTHNCTREEAKQALFPILYAYSTSIDEIEKLVKGENKYE